MRPVVAARQARSLVAGWCSGAAAAAIALTWLAYAFLGHHGHGGHGAVQPSSSAHHMDHMAGMHHGAMEPMPAPVLHHTAWWLVLLSWMAMTVAMMGPATLPAVGYVEQNTLRWRRGRAVALFAAVWLAIWCVVGVAVTLAQPVVVGERWGALSLALGIAALWQLSAWKRRALNDCHRSTPLPPYSWRAARGVARFGVLSGTSCVRSCWAMMIAMALAPALHLFWMVFLTVVVTYERFSQHPRRAARHVALALGAAALSVGVYAIAR